MGIYTSLLCSPNSKVELLLHQYHTNLIGRHNGITKPYRTISDRFYCPNLAFHLRASITGCHFCQLFKNAKSFSRPFQKRINLNIPSLTKISIDFKHMPKSTPNYKFILVLLCKNSNFMAVEYTKTNKAPEVCKVLYKTFIRYIRSPTHIVTDQHPAFLSSLCQYFFKAFGIKLVTVSPTNHKSLLAEHGIKSLSNIMVKHLTSLGKNWDMFLDPAMLTNNTYSIPNLDSLSPFKITLGRKVT